MNSTVSKEEINKIIKAEHHDAHQIMGIHPVKIDNNDAFAVRSFYPYAKSIKVKNLDNSEIYQMQKISPAGFFEAVILTQNQFTYELVIESYEGNTETKKDPYTFLPTISDYDLHLFNEGNHFFIYNKLGAHVTNINNVNGVTFAVWAPNAVRVSVIGEFNCWDGRVHMMHILGNSGVWEIFIPEINYGSIYKFEILTKTGSILVKSDPYSLYSEVRPKTASCVYNIDKYIWQDSEWMDKRQRVNPLNKPVNIYEVHLGSWMRVPEENHRFLTYRELAERLVSYVLEMGYTHIELLPIAEHPLDRSWGYQVTGYYSPTSRFGTPDDFMYFVDYCHKNNIGVIVDWVPAHFPKDGHSLIRFDGTCIYEHEDPKRGEHSEWGTLIFNYGRHEVKNFLIANAMFWFDKYHIDGIRVDAVASMLYLDYSRKEGEWIPNAFGGRENLEAIDFLQQLNIILYKYFPGIITLAEESTAWPGVSHPTYAGGLGFGMKWNMGWMHDILEYFTKDTIFRKYHHQNLTFTLLYAFHENFILPISHDEVVHGKRALLDKMPGDFWQKFSNLRLLFSYMYGQPGKKLTFMGGEIGQWYEWNFDESIHWHLLEHLPHKKLQKFVRDLNFLYRNESALWENDFEYTGFEWIDFSDSSSSIVSFIRKGKNNNVPIIMVFNFTPVPRYDYCIGVPYLCFYKEILNSDSDLYGGSNMGNSGGVWAINTPLHGRPYSVKLTLPPLGALFFKPEI
ncbi:MAG: 1,4-alpha-glucan branching protein GlgB [Candidatus Firestonebacteria bacterium]|nr:1,4-alpha-glucan branching protein GlgB [Candidatus Firestonebacteria bacterium]